MIEKMNTELELILHKKHVILRLLQNATLKKEKLPIPVNLHRYLYGFSKLILPRLSPYYCYEFHMSGPNKYF
jgi:hypothetical protein